MLLVNGWEISSLSYLEYFTRSGHVKANELIIAKVGESTSTSLAISNERLRFMLMNLVTLARVEIMDHELFSVFYKSISMDEVIRSMSPQGICY